MIRHKVSFIMSCFPWSYQAQIAIVPGVASRSFTGHGSRASTERSEQFLRQLSPSSRSTFLAMYPEFESYRRIRSRRGLPTAPARSSARPGQTLRLEDRRPHPAAGYVLPSTERPTVGVHDRRDVRLDQTGRRQDAALLQLPLPGRDGSGGPRECGLVRDQGERAKNVGPDRTANRRAVRKLAGRNEDGHGEGLRAGVRGADWRHRQRS